MASDLSPLLQGINSLGQELCRLTASNETSFIVSPIGIHSILTFLSQDSCFANKEDFKLVLNTDVNNVNDKYKQVISFLKKQETGTQFFMNKGFFDNQFEMKESLKTQLLDNFLYELNLLNFNERNSAIELMNIWVNDKTSDKAKNLVNTGNVDRNTCMTLLNSTYFDEKWAKPFTETAPGAFYINESEILQTEMMKIKSEFFYKNDVSNRCKILQLPFKNDDVSLIIILPDSMEKFGDFGKFYSYDIRSLMDNMTLQEVDVMLPKFNIEKSLGLRDYLSKMGLAKLFVANFTDAINGEETHLSNIQQRVFIDVNKEGLEAASGLFCSISKEEKEKELIKNGLIMYEMNIKTDISNRFAKTKVVWKTKNIENYVKHAAFKVVLSEMAFITGLVMEIEGKSYESYIKEKCEAKTIYNEAVTRGQSAGLVEAKTRDSKKFSVSVNLEPDTVAVFTLTYEELLQRIHDQYELALNICPGQIVNQLNIEVDIMESRPISFVKTPPLRSGKTISKTEYEDYLKPESDIRMINAKTASVKFSPNAAEQKKLACYLETVPDDGLSGVFVVQYDVERDSLNGEVLLKDGYFVHFFAPNDLDPLPKHVVFVLDTSGSMGGIKIIQLMDAMTSILNELRENDLIDIIEFNSEVIVWDINSNNQESTVIPAFYDTEDFQDPFNKLRRLKVPDSTLVNKETLSKAKNVVHRMYPFGSTYIIGGLETALYLVKVAQDKEEGDGVKRQPIIVFLTDGEPNVGISSTTTIVDIVSRLNLKYNKVPIFSLSFGRDADKSFLRTLSLKNQGFARHIYEAADASLQLQDFYRQISSPLLADVHFKYDSEVDEVTKTRFPIYFGGSELVVTGRYRETFVPTKIKCCGPRGTIIVNSIIGSPVASLERLWAYLMVKQLLDERETSDNKTEITNKAICLALKYHFVTDVTSLVVVKPNESSTINDHARNWKEGPFRMDIAASAVRFGSCSNTGFGQSANNSYSFGQGTFGAQSTATGISFGGSSTLFGQQTSFGASPFAANPLNQSITTSTTQQSGTTAFSFKVPSTQPQMGISQLQQNSSFQFSASKEATFEQKNVPKFSFGTPLVPQNSGTSDTINQFPTGGTSQGVNNTFGHQSPSSGLFNKPFGQQSGNNLFGQQPSSSSLFNTPFGQQSGVNVFGQQPSSGSPFGTPFGQQSGINVFGQQPFSSSPFNKRFGQQSSTSIFGTQPFSSGFNTSFGTQSVSTGSTFGRQNSPSAPFSQFPTDPFNNPLGFNWQQTNAPQASNSGRRGGTRIKEYEKKSFEELRFEYYVTEKKENSTVKKVQEFVADHPFIIILQFKKDESVVLFNGCVFEPTRTSSS